MDEILKSEILIVVCGEKDGVSLTEFGGLFRQIHGYNLNLLNYGYSSLRKLLNDMNDLIELTTINGQHMIRCKVPSRHQVIVSFGNNSQAKEQVSGYSSVPIPSSGPSLGPAARKTEQAQPMPLQLNHVKVYTTNSATDKEFKETSKSKCPVPAKNNYTVVTHRKSAQARKCGLSLNEKAARINKKTKKHEFSANPKSETFNSVHTTPSRKVAIAADAAKTNNVSQISQGSISKSSHPKPERNLASLQNVSSAKPRSIENKAFVSTTGHGIQPNMSYASICASNINKNQFNDNAQQFTPKYTKFNVDTRINSANVSLSYSRAEPKESTQSTSVIKNNIQMLLNKHADGISVFQLQKLYLSMFQQLLRFKGFNTMKQFLLELKDVLRTEGLGVQMRAFPVSAENNSRTASNGNLDGALKLSSSLITKKLFEREVVIYPHSSDPLKTQSDKLQEAARLPVHDDHILTSEQESIDQVEGHIANLLKTKQEPLTLQNMKYVETPFNVKCTESLNNEKLSMPSSVGKVLPKQKSQCNAPPNAQTNHKMSKNKGIAEISYLCINETPNKATSQKEPSQNLHQDSSLSQLILHSSGFSFVMGQQTNGSDNKGSETDIVEMPRSLTDQRMPYHSKSILKDPEQLQQMLFNTNSSMKLQDRKLHQLSSPHEQNTNHLLLQPYNSMDTIKTCGQIECPTLQTANNCSITEYPSSHSVYSMQCITIPAEIETPSSIQEKCSSQNKRLIERDEYSFSNLQAKAPNSLTVNNMNNASHLSSSEKVPDVQNKKAIQKTSQHEARVSPPTNALGNGNTQNFYVHNSEQAAQTLTDVHKPAVERKQSTLTVQIQQPDECTNPERIAQCNLSSLGSRQDIIDLPQSIPEQPTATQSALQNNLESVSEQGDMTTWQTSQAQVCCVL
ncbi:uncharacterized protein RB166_012542 isoform 2-T3 [Leptodactylus fuscus]|uniref:uncharacterized protein LOC142208334 isoform X2 n=1 Tax=Leptodactylus fuscus TaxID=238119 RepID=UPI003F4ED793